MTPEQITEFPCPAGDGVVAVTTTRQRRAIAAGGVVYHSRECQKAASRETRPCDACGAPVTRRRSEFTEGKLACSPQCRGRLKATAVKYKCANHCGRTVLRTPANVRGDVYCSRKCFGEGTRSSKAVVAVCANADCAVEFRVTETPRIERARNGLPVYHSRECWKDATRVTLPCANECGRTVWRYRSTLSNNPEGRAVRVFCAECRDSGTVSMKPRRGTTKPCATCGNPVYRRPSEDDGGPRYCSYACHGKSLEGERVERPERSCIVCDKTFRLEPDQVRQDVQTCSRKCANASRRRKSGERYVEPSGYARITTPDGRDMAEHRYVMETHIGRTLLPTETVHHKTGGFAGRSNNALGNLELWSGRHPSGHRVEDIVLYCREMLAMYGDDAEKSRYASFRRAVEEDDSRPVGELLDEAMAALEEGAESLPADKLARLAALAPKPPQTVTT